MEVALMAINDFITSTLNLRIDQIDSLDSVRKDNALHIHVKLKDAHPKCPYCGGDTKSKGYTHHTYNHLKMGGAPSYIEWKRRRYLCKDCGKSFVEVNPFGPETFHQTYALLRHVADELANIHNSYKDIALRNNISTTLVELYCDSFVQVPRLTLPENLGIDEIHSGMAKYGGSYLCSFVDNNKRCLNELLPDRSKRTLSRHLEAIPLSERKRVKYVTIDMWEPYKDISLKYFPNCEIAVDPFHVVKHLSDSFSRIRIDIMNASPKGSASYYLLKSWHKLLETDYDLDNEPQYNKFFKQKMNFRQLYDALLSLNPSLTLAYNLKEMYRDFNKRATEENCEEWFNQLLQSFKEAHLYCYEEFIGLLENWKPEILNSFKRPYENRKQSNALAESINRSLRILMAVSNGLNNFDRFRARAIYCLNKFITYSLTSHIFRFNKRQGKPRGPYKKTDDLESQ